MRSLILHAAAALALSAPVAGRAQETSRPAAAPMVSTHEGRLAGTTGADGVRRFFGIPYARPPVGDLRWRAPVAPVRRSGVRDATGFGARCRQLPLFADMVFRSPGTSEDCLFLNLWEPAPSRTKLPILFYLYGGGFQAGDSSEPRYDGAAMAARGMVVVTVNYRLGVFGFMAHPSLTAESPAHASGNYGLLDQAAALDWVRRNAAAFGGDPARITIAGESAGSMSVSALMASPLARGRFAGAIGESGAMMQPTIALPSLAEAERDGQALATAAGAADLAALRAMPADRLLAVAAGLRFGPAIDGLFLREDPALTFAASREASVPLLLGSNSQEGSWQGIVGADVPTVAGYRAGLARLFGAEASAIERLYPATTPAEVVDAGTALASDRFITQSTWRWFDRHRRTGAPTFYYRFTRVRPPDLGAPAPAVALTGAVHSAEIEYALGNLHTHDGYAWTADDDRISAQMSGYVASFVRRGDPNGGGLPAWPAAPATADAPVPRQEIGLATGTRPATDQTRHVAVDPLLHASR